ncbi:MAG: type II secretion system F family protein [Candidatus Nealsonbacteria bacterium]|nr:type II secretion system F family protein [Candidatus Nealsonbacteria bacterium]
MRFNYQGRLNDGQLQSGVVEASSRDEAIALLQKSGIYIIFLEEITPSFYTKEIKFLERVSKKDVVIFSRQLSIMFRSGIPIIESLRTIAEQINKKKFKREIYKIADKVDGGNMLSQALLLFPETFTSFYVGMIKSGEISGRLSESLEYLADHLERDYNFNNKVIGALIYPVFIIFVFITILVLLVVFVVPGLKDVFEGMELPWSTRFILGLGDFIVAYWWVIILATIGSVFSLYKFFKTQAGKSLFDKVVFKVPLIGDFVRKVNLIRIAENLSTLIAGGLPIVQALEATVDLVGSGSYKKILYETRDGVRRGELISSILINYPEYFPSLFTQMIIVGEKTGKIDSSLVNVVHFYRGDIDRSLEGMVKLIEPLMIVVIGGMIGLMVVSLLTPIYQVTV